MKPTVQNKLIQYSLVGKLNKKRMDAVYQDLSKYSYGFGWNVAARIPTFKHRVTYNVSAKGFMMDEDLLKLTEDKVIYGEVKDSDWGLRDCTVTTQDMEEEGVLEYYESINDLL